MAGGRFRGARPWAALARGMGAAVLVAVLALSAAPAAAQTYAAYVMDARTGETLYERNADQRLHPASLTKMMTLYLAIEAVKEGRLGLDQRVRISANAARQPPSRMGLRAGQRVSVRDLMRAAAVRSANDAATALAEATAGSVEAWSRLATHRAQTLGMRHTTFRNPHGLTQSGHLSTARDMAILGRRLFFDHPEYYNLFSRTRTTAMGRTINATNRRLLENYRGADGIKTGYTRAAGFNLVASAQRGDRHVIASVFGGRSSADRNDKIVRLLDLGFDRAPRFAKTIPPVAPPVATVAEAPAPPERPGAPRTLLAQVGDALVPAAHADTPSQSRSRMAPRTAALPAPRPGPAARASAKGGETVAAVLPPRRPTR